MCCEPARADGVRGYPKRVIVCTRGRGVIGRPAERLRRRFAAEAESREGGSVEIKSFVGQVDAAAYGSAVITIVWSRERSSGKRYVIFGHVELLPHEFPPPLTTDEWTDRLGGDSDHYLYGRRIVVGAALALEWYTAATTGVWTRPADDGTISAVSADGMEQPLQAIAQEPTWPSTVMRTSGKDLLPFVPNTHACPRVHHILCEAPEIFQLFTDEERGRAAEIIRQRLYFDIKKPGHLWQSIHLTAPDPRIRRVETTLNTSTDDSIDTAVQVALVPRAGEDTRGIMLRIKEVRETGQRLLARIEAPERVFRAPLTEPIDQIVVEVEDEARGLIYTSGPHPFLRSIRLQMSIGGSTRRVVAPARRRSAAVQYDVTVSAPDRPMIMGHSPAMTGSKLFRDAERALTALTKSAQQYWFDGDPNIASAFVRGLLGRAQKRVRVIDLFFGAGEVAHYLPAVAHAESTLEVLTSREGLGRRSKLTDEAGGYREQAAALRAEVERYVSSRLMNRTQVRVMTGARAEVHDRFLCVDDDIWLVGSSFNEFGSRGTMLVKLPEPDSVRTKLDAAWDGAVTLENVLEPQS